MAANYQSAPATVQYGVHGEGDSAAIAFCGKVGWGISVAEKNPIAKLICGQLGPIAGAGMGGEPCTSELSSIKDAGFMAKGGVPARFEAIALKLPSCAAMRVARAALRVSAYAFYKKKTTALENYM